jgi:nitrilase
VVSCCTGLRAADLPDRLREHYYTNAPEWVNRGRSVIVEPGGGILAGPADSVQEILYADADLALTRGPRWMLDVAGHYARPDIFELRVHRQPQPMLREGGSVDRLVDAFVD